MLRLGIDRLRVRQFSNILQRSVTSLSEPLVTNPSDRVGFLSMKITMKDVRRKKAQKNENTKKLTETYLEISSVVVSI